MPKRELHYKEESAAELRTSVPARIVYEAIRRDGEAEMRRGPSALAWSAVAAGLSMGVSLLAESILRLRLPAADWTPLVSKLGYSAGFVIVILGKQQLFTENTLTPIIPLAEDRTMAQLRRVAMLWFVVLLGNLVGAHAVAWFFASTPVLSPEMHTPMTAIATEATEPSGWVAFIRGIPGGWLIAIIVWLRAAVDADELAIIILLTWIVGAGEFTHIVAGSVEYLYLVMRGEAAWLSWVTGYMLPVLAGNIAGGVSITAALNHAQVVAERDD